MSQAQSLTTISISDHNLGTQSQSQTGPRNILGLTKCWSRKICWSGKFLGPGKFLVQGKLWVLQKKLGPGKSLGPGKILVRGKLWVRGKIWCPAKNLVPAKILGPAQIFSVEKNTCVCFWTHVFLIVNSLLFQKSRKLVQNSVDREKFSYFPPTVWLESTGTG